MKMYWPTPPEKAAISAAICAGVKAMNWQTTSKPALPSARYAAASLMSPRIARTLGGKSAAVAPRLKMLTSWPAATASTTQGSEMLPAPPTKRIFRDMARSFLGGGGVGGFGGEKTSASAAAEGEPPQAAAITNP